VKKRNKENIILFLLIVFIPAVVYFSFFNQTNNIVCAHTFSDDNTASVLAIIEEYKQELYSIKNDVGSNMALARLHMSNILDQSYVSRIANQIYPTASLDNGDLTKSLNQLNELFFGNAAKGENSSNARINDGDSIKTEANKIDSLLDECKNIFLADRLTKNNTVDALVIKNLLDSSLRFYEAGVNTDSKGDVVSIKNGVYYQNALVLANRSNQILNQMDLSQFQNNATKANLFKDVHKDSFSFENLIKNKENPNAIVVLLHMNIHPNLMKLFTLK
jgi:hypothetical protein